MTNKSILALVVSSSGDLQNGLLALMTTIPPVGAVLVAEDVEAALRMAENHQPTLIILEKFSLKMQDLIKQIKGQYPKIYLVALVNDTAHQKVADECGADSVLIKGFPPQKLVEIVEDLVAPTNT